MAASPQDSLQAACCSSLLPDASIPGGYRMNKRKTLGPQKKGFFQLVRRDAALLVILAIPVIYMLVYKYLPMAGLLMAFKDVPRRGGFMSIFNGENWVGLKNFRDFFGTQMFGRLLKNTFLLSVYNILWSFPVPIVFALMLNEIRRKRYQRTLQTLAYLPYFISLVVAMAIVLNLLSPSSGLFNQIRNAFGLESIHFMGDPKYFRTIYVASGIWQTFGYSAIIYVAAITSIDQQMYEAAVIDGASRWQQLLHITLPSIMPTVIIMLIMSLGNVLNVGFEKVILLYSPTNYSVSDVLSTYVYRMGLASKSPNYGLATAAGLFNSVVNFTLVIIFNKIARKTTEISLW